MIDILKPLIQQFMPFAQKQMGFSRVPRLFLKNDEGEANNPMGKTGFYDPNDESITVYIGKRHPKDIMRSLSHELMHHTQKCNGEFEDTANMGEEGYAQNDTHLRSMEIQAYQASIVFRDWEDSTKGTIYYEHLQKGDKKMSTKDWKNKELTILLSEAWGFKFNTLEEFNEFNGPGEVQEEAAEADVTEEQEADDGADITEDEEIEEQSGTDRPDRRGGGKAAGGRRLDEEDEEIEEEVEVSGKKPTKEQIEALIKKVIKERLQKRKG